jgi:hypothetical protein
MAVLVAACSGPSQPDTDCAAGKCDVFDTAQLAVCKETEDFATDDGTLRCTPCGDVVKDRSGRGFLPAFVANDALVQKVYMTFEDTNGNKRIDDTEIDCPVDMPSIMAKLARTDAKDCTGGIGGIATRVISETAAPLGEMGASYRAVTSRDCATRGPFGLLFSSFGFTGKLAAKGTGRHISETEHPGEVEIIALDEVDGVFNFYKELDGTMQFFGSSLDYTVAGPGGPDLTSTRGCANCHTGGGLIMKELVSPWTHWAGTDFIPGADQLVASRASYMGRLESGIDMEVKVTQPGNARWNAEKTRFLSGASSQDLEATRARLVDDAMSASEKADLARRQLKTV